MNKIINVNGTDLPNFNRLDATDGTIFGRHNKVMSVNPYKTRFIAEYPNGKVIFGTGLFQTGWDQIPQGLSKLKYELSTGHIIELPKYLGYLSTVEVSFGMDGSRIFHFINVNCLTDKADREVVIYKIVLRQDSIVPQKIGDIIMSKQPLPTEKHSSWKYTS